MGSVKDLKIDTHPTQDKLGKGRFHFTDSYSVFDWGRMPDEIENKGKSLCTMGAFNFELLEAASIPTHYRGVVEDGEVKYLDDLDGPSDEMAVFLAEVPELSYEGSEYDYGSFHQEAGETYLIPLEIVFRNAVPPESSFRDRYSPEDLNIDLEEWPDGNYELQDPVVEYSTKFEEKDRYLSEEEARSISGLGDELKKVEDIAHHVNEVVTEHSDDVGFVHVDGKIECVYHQGDVLVADVVGTFDENRFLYSPEQKHDFVQFTQHKPPSDAPRKQISKEFLRKYYREYDSEWVGSVKDAKQEAEEQGVEDWRSLCGVDPKPLPGDVATTASRLYTAGANLYTGEKWFDAPHLSEVVDKI
ncbi:MAG: phosphoribosylaminoimidazolesuccinocarboxamide synthase [Halobacteria archaeon]